MSEIVPSLLSADFGRLEDEVRAVEGAGAHRLHLDVMDGHFVPLITFGPLVVRAVRRTTDLHLEAHLMVARPESQIAAFHEAGADTIIIHEEAAMELSASLKVIKDLGLKAGVALNPATPISRIEEVAERIDLLLLMTVNPGFAGQRFIPYVLGKVQAARSRFGDSSMVIEVDGGINETTVGDATGAGADLLVAGSAVFDGDNAAAAFRSLSARLDATAVPTEER